MGGKAGLLGLREIGRQRYRFWINRQTARAYSAMILS